MKKLFWFACGFSALFFNFARASGYNLATVRHRWQEIITESNHAALRPGSVYDIVTHFEQNSGIIHPQFNYFFFDTGLGAADPIYPVYQTGFQENWKQLIKGGIWDDSRHIDHFSVGDTPEGCRIKSVYWVRHINEFPGMYEDLRAEGYTLVDISFDYYEKLRSDAQCGKHTAHELSENFDPFAEIYPYNGVFKTFADIPPELLKHYEAKVGILKLVSEKFKGSAPWKSYDQIYSLRDNSMWFYPDGFAPNYGMNKAHTQTGLANLTKTDDLFYPATSLLQMRLPLKQTLGREEFEKVLDELKGKPNAKFDPNTEPGNDTLDITTQVTPKNFYTSGTTIEPIRDVVGDVSDPDHFKLVSIVMRPAEPEADVHFEAPQDIPQLRMVYQLMSPRHEGRAYEQLFLHLDFDAIDRMLPPAVRKVEAARFLHQLDDLTKLRHQDLAAADQATLEFINQVIKARPLQTVSWSSSLTGIWVFGIISRSYNSARNLEASPIIREGINVGYYSTAYDTVLFREAIAKSSGKTKSNLEKVIDDLIPKFYRDPRRHDPNALTFNRVTCAQCHQMAGRDGVHVLLNDGLDRRIKTSYRATEYVFRELERQLTKLPWLGDSNAH